MAERTSPFRINPRDTAQDFSPFLAQPDIAPEEATPSPLGARASILSLPAWAYAAIAFVGLVLAIITVLI